MREDAAGGREAGTDPVDAARRALASVGTFLMPAADLWRSIGADADPWVRFSAHWEELAPDPYAAEQGVHRLRRYGRFRYRAVDGALEPTAHGEFVQPDDSNLLYLGRDRHFEPLTAAFLEDPLFERTVKLVGRIAPVLDDAPEWTVWVHPFRVVASADNEGRPTPEGVHRDGVTLVGSLLIGVDNAVGGESSVFGPDGERLVTATPREPGTFLLGDDRCTWHGVSPIRPVDRGEPARRDVLVVTFTPSASCGGP